MPEITYVEAVQTTLRDEMRRDDRVIVMGARPGHIIEECLVGLPRPRHVAQIALPPFGELVAQIRLALERGASVPVSRPRMTAAHSAPLWIA